MSGHGLMLGASDLVDGVPSEEGFVLRVLGEEFSTGSPEIAVTEVVAQLLDGNAVIYDRHGSRVVTMLVQVEAPDGIALQAGEVALRRELYRENTLTWTPPAVASPPTVFVVEWSHFEPLFDKLDEINTRRKYRVTLTCAPFARSVNLTTVPALDLPMVSSDIVVDECDSATGWTAAISHHGVGGTAAGPFVPATVSTTWSAGAVSVVELVQEGGQTLRLERTGLVALTASTRYLVAEIGYNASFGVVPVTCWLERPTGASSVGMVKAPLIEVRQLSPGWFRFVWSSDVAPLGPLSTDVIRFEASTSTRGADLKIRRVLRTANYTQSTRQLSRVIEVGGTERTPGTLHIQTADGTGSTGLTMVHTSLYDGSGYYPALDRFRIWGNDAGRAVEPLSPSGWSEPIHPDPVIASVPTSMIPSDGYTICAWLQSDTLGAHPIWWSARTTPPGMSEQGHVSGRAVHDFTITGWELVVLGTVTLPTVDGAAGEVQFDIQLEAGGSSNVRIGEWWFFRAGEGSALTVAANPHPHMWITSPQIGEPSRVEVGTDAARTHPGEGMFSMGDHIFPPEGVLLFMVTAAEGAKADGSYYKQWPHNAAE